MRNDMKVTLTIAMPLSVVLVKGGTLKVFPGAPHGMCSMLKDKVNADLLAFIKG